MRILQGVAVFVLTAICLAGILAYTCGGISLNGGFTIQGGVKLEKRPDPPILMPGIRG